MDLEEEVPLQEKHPQVERARKDGILGLIVGPFYWLRKLSDELHWSFVLGVVIVYGINQGLCMGLSKVSTQYYMKDEQKLQPSEAQVYFGFIQIPWIIKPLWGLFTDTVPIAGNRRRPYFIIAGVIGATSMIILSIQTNLYIVYALLLLIGGSLGVAVADVTIDACVTENSIRHPSLAGDMQSLCGFSSSVGQLIGYTISGFLVHIIGSKGVFGLLSIPAGLVILVGMIIQEPFIRNVSYKRVNQKFVDAGMVMWTALKCPVVWRPCLYMYLSLAEVVGSISAVGAVGSLLGVLLYQNAFRKHPFRGVLFWAQLLYGASGMLDLILVSRINLQFGLPDYALVVIDSAVSHMIGRLKWMPLLVLSSKLCPSGIEGTFFALLMAIDHVGSFTASWAGGLLLHSLNVTRTTFDNLWLAILIRSVFRVLPLVILFLIPSGDPNAAILPAEMLRTKKSDGTSDPNNTEMDTLINSVH
ncbi:putative folate-biopterin transporter 3-like [Dorcoceras hygrometricum]|uniref:Putative folate-biopterin transporter 3-like n=1 Tax=Dorcoceras hygrometricum TaxID=472368 RepID=A0A2Z7DF04_9LAMI|nr:putative folate-biopterin transporter 3-like [Dorcoceras hygrometricum]